MNEETPWGTFHVLGHKPIRKVSSVKESRGSWGKGDRHK